VSYETEKGRREEGKKGEKAHDHGSRDEKDTRDSEAVGSGQTDIRTETDS
jgi:hypothetical protein